MVENKINNFKIQRVFNMVIVLFIIVLVIISLDFIRNRAKDTKRKVDIRQIKSALDLYHSAHGNFPAVEDGDFSGWDITYDALRPADEFLRILEKEKYINKVPVDPINSDLYYYRYKKFPVKAYGCDRAFYILQAMNLEGDTQEHGWGSCPGRDFVAEAPNGYTIQIFE